MPGAVHPRVHHLGGVLLAPGDVLGPRAHAGPVGPVEGVEPVEVHVVEEAAVAHVLAVRPGHRGQPAVRDEGAAAGRGALGVDQREHLALRAAVRGRPGRGAGAGAGAGAASGAGAGAGRRSRRRRRGLRLRGRLGLRGDRRRRRRGRGHRGCSAAATAADGSGVRRARRRSPRARPRPHRRRGERRPPTSGRRTSPRTAVRRPGRARPAWWTRCRPSPASRARRGHHGAEADAQRQPSAAVADGAAARRTAGSMPRSRREGAEDLREVVHALTSRSRMITIRYRTETNGARKVTVSPGENVTSQRPAPGEGAGCSRRRPGGADQAPWGRTPHPRTSEEYAAGERRLAQHRHGRRLRPDRRCLLRRGDRPGLPARVAGAGDGGDAAAAGRRCRSCSATPTSSWPPSRWASRFAGFFSAAFGASTLSEPFAGWLREPRRLRGARRHARAGAGHHRDQLPVPRRRRADAEAAGPAAGRGLLAHRRRAAQRARQAVPAGHLAAVEVDQRPGPAASAATPSRAARRSARRSCATWWPRTSRSAATSAGSSTRSSAPASARSARS